MHSTPRSLFAFIRCQARLRDVPEPERDSRYLAMVNRESHEQDDVLGSIYLNHTPDVSFQLVEILQQ
jgi:hypothetical protein